MLPDSDPCMSNAHETYRELGFEETEAYAEAEMDGNDYSQRMTFMKLDLADL